MENQKQTPIRSFSAAGAAKLREMSENPELYADFLRFQGRIFKHNANVALEFFVQNPETDFIVTQEQWEQANHSIAQNAKSVQFMDTKGNVQDFYDFSQIVEDTPPHRWTLHTRNVAQIKAALGIPEKSSLVNSVILSSLTPQHISTCMSALHIPPSDFQKFSKSFVSSIHCIIAGRLEVGGNTFQAVPDASIFSTLKTEPEKIGFLNLAANAARAALRNIEKAALEWEAAESLTVKCQ